MKQERKERSSILASRIAVCLCLGAITTIGVAWIVAVSIDWSKHPGREMSTIPNNGGAISRAVSTGPAHLRISNTSGFIYDIPSNLPVAPAPDWSLLKQDAPNYPPYVEEAAYGWPRLALRCWCEDQGKPAWSRICWGVPIARFKPVAIPFNLFQGNIAGAIPLRPISVGFLIDSAVFGACWAVLLFIPTAIKRSLRRRHGLCPRCAYDLRADFTQGCPECGWNRTIPTESSP